MPVRRLLVHPRGPQQLRLAEIGSEQLQPDRQRLVEPVVNPQGRLIPAMPAMLQVTVKTSHRYICSGSPVFSPALKAGVGLVGQRITSHFSNASVEVALDQRVASSARQVVGVVVAAGEGVRADHDAALDLFAEPFGAALG